MECKYSIRSFGVNVEGIPTVIPGVNSENNQNGMKNHLKWLAMRNKIDAEIVKNATTGAINSNRQPSPQYYHRFVECPRHEDCLFGKGEPIMRHPGNIAMRQLLYQRWERYETAAYKDKKKIALEIVTEIKNGGGRFLREDPFEKYCFVEVSEDEARQKCSNALRDVVQRQRMKETKKHEQQQRRASAQTQKQQRQEQRQKQEEGTPLGDPSAFLALSDNNGFVPKRRKLAFDGDENDHEEPITCLGMFCNDRKVSPNSEMET